MKTNQLQKNIPHGWQNHKLGDLVDIMNGKTPLKSRGEFWNDGDIPWFTIDDIRSEGRFVHKTNQTITKFALEESGIKMIPENSTLICCTASVGEYAFTKIPLTTNQQFNALVPKNKKTINPLFLYYVSQTFDSRLKQIMGSTTFGFVSVGTLSDFDIEIPSDIKEQEKIAEILSRVDEDIEKTEKIIEKTEKLMSGLMQRLLIKGIKNTKFKKVKIGEITKVVRGGSPRPIEYYITDDPDGLNWLRIGDIDINDKYILKTTDKIKKEGLKKTVQVYSDELILSNSMSFGRPYIMKIDACIHDGWLAFKNISKDINVEYLYYLLSSNEIQGIFYSLAVGSGVKNLKRETVSEMYINIPPINEQKDIVEILSSVDRKISVNKKLKEKLTQLKKGLMSDLLSGKVRVK